MSEKQKIQFKRAVKPVVGRPSKYDPKYCELLIEHMSEGLSFETFAVTIGVVVSTTYDWARDHKEFSEAKRYGFAACQYFYEQMGRSGMTKKGFNAAIWIYNVKCRFRQTETWQAIKDEVDVNISPITYKTTMTEDGRLIQEMISEMNDQEEKEKETND